MSRGKEFCVPTYPPRRRRQRHLRRVRVGSRAAASPLLSPV